jgi:hypothetical protein
MTCSSMYGQISALYNSHRDALRQQCTAHTHKHHLRAIDMQTGEQMFWLL